MPGTVEAMPTPAHATTTPDGGPARRADRPLHTPPAGDGLTGLSPPLGTARCRWTSSGYSRRVRLWASTCRQVCRSRSVGKPRRRCSPPSRRWTASCRLIAEYIPLGEPLPELPKCWSACTLLFVSGVVHTPTDNVDARSEGNIIRIPTIAVHRPAFVGDMFGRLPPARLSTPIRACWMIWLNFCRRWVQRKNLSGCRCPPLLHRSSLFLATKCRSLSLCHFMKSGFLLVAPLTIRRSRKRSCGLGTGFTK